MIWYTSDLHLMHDKVAQHRGYTTAVEHDQVITENWANNIAPDDTVYVLGDITLKNPKRIVDTIQSLPGTKHLIAGNHDQCHPLMSTKWRNKLPAYQDMFTTIALYDRHRIGNHQVMLSHFPYTADHTDTIRHPEYRIPDHGLWLLHGHTHHSKILDAGPWQIHIGLDAWQHTPVPQTTIHNIITAHTP